MATERTYLISINMFFGIREAKKDARFDQWVCKPAV